MTNFGLAAAGCCATEDLQRFQSRIDFVIQDVDALGRSCSSETAADFQPTDENVNLHGPSVDVPYFISPPLIYRPDTKPEPARGKRKDFSTILLCSSGASDATAGTQVH